MARRICCRAGKAPIASHHSPCAPASPHRLGLAATVAALSTFGLLAILHGEAQDLVVNGHDPYLYVKRQGIAIAIASSP